MPLYHCKRPPPQFRFQHVLVSIRLMCAYGALRGEQGRRGRQRVVVLNSRYKIREVVLNSRCTQSKVQRLERGHRAQEEHHRGVRGTEERRRERESASNPTGHHTASGKWRPDRKLATHTLSLSLSTSSPLPAQQ